MNVARDRARQYAARGRAFGTERVDEKDWDRILVDQGPAPDANATQVEERERIVRALATLSEPHRAIIMLSDLEGLSCREIAEVLDIPMGTVMSRLHNARKRLRDVLGPLLALLLVVLATLGPLMVEAQQLVRFSVQVLVASDAATEPLGRPPEELQQLIPKLRQLFRYQQYRLLQQYRGQAPVGGVQRWVVAGDRTLEITPESVTDNTARLQVRLQRGSVMEVTTSMQATPNAPALIGGPRHDGGVLIVVVRTIP